MNTFFNTAGRVKSIGIAAFRLFPVIIWLLVQALPIWSNDGAAEVALGGIVLKKEARISMAKERLTIALNKITVEYEFLNDTEQNITTQIAFPIPEYILWCGEDYKRISDFKLWVDDRLTLYKTEVRAFLKDREYTQLLEEMKIPIDICEDALNLKDHPEQQKKILYDTGLVDKRDDGALWSVRKTYYWEQTFPAHQIVRIRHEYTPVAGSSVMGYESYDAEIFKGSCIPKALMEKIRIPKYGEFNEDYRVHAFWVKYILTTANTWKTPIKEFELIVEKSPKPDFFASNSILRFIQFCWDGVVEKVDEKRFRARVTNFIPQKELTVYYFFEYPKKATPGKM